MSDISAFRNDGIIDQLLAEAGLHDADGLRPALLELRMLASEQPQASAQVQALMAPVFPATTLIPATPIVPVAPEASACTDELAARRRMKRRLTLTTFSVAVSLAAGVAVAAASDQGMRDTVASFVSTFTGGTGGNTGDKPVPSDSGAGGGSPVPAPVGSVPAPAETGTAPQQPDGQGTPEVAPPALPRGARVPGISVSGRAIVDNLVPGQGTGQEPVRVPPIPGPLPTSAITVPPPTVPAPWPHPAP